MAPNLSNDGDLHFKEYQTPPALKREKENLWKRIGLAEWNDRTEWFINLPTKENYPLDILDQYFWLFDDEEK